MLVLMEEAYDGNTHGGIVPAARETDPDLAGGDATLDDGMMGCPTSILPIASSSYVGPH
jgi:hypothetical protein